MTHDYIPVSMPDLSGNEEIYVLEALRSSWISSTGKFVDRFESDFAHLCNVRHVVPVSNGTVALHVALLALGVGPGDEVIVPALTYIATANAVRYVNAHPVFVDVDSQTWCMDPTLLESAITSQTRAIIVVHLYGHPADMDEIHKVARIHGIPIVEDAAEALFAKYKGGVVGGLGRIATFSFYGNKVMSCGEGGAVVANDDDLAYRIRILRGQGMDPDRRYYFPITGYNYRLTNLACAILCAQLERAEKIMARRHEIFATYRSALNGIPGIGFQPVADWAEISPWLYCITVEPNSFGHSREDLADHLQQNRVETRPFFIPIHTLPPFRANQSSIPSLPVTMLLASQGLNLPTYPSIADSQIDYICNLIRKFQK